jgi:hypothetical protein
MSNWQQRYGLLLGLILLIPRGAGAEQTTPFGNNEEALRFATAMTQIAASTWPKANIVWHLELTPARLGENLERYRQSVTTCKARILVNEEWYKETETSQRTFVESAMNVLHKAAAFPDKTLDYYPNSSGEVSIIVGNRTVASGQYTKTKATVSLKSGTSKSAKPSADYTAKVVIENEGSKPRFRIVTNLPAVDSILITLARGSYMAQDKATVRNGECVSALFGYEGGTFPPGVYSLELNVFDPTTGLMIQARGRVNLFQTKAVELTFAKTKL